MATTYNASGQLAEAINYLKYKGVIKTQKDVAEKMKATPSNVSGALSGNEKILTSRFLKRFNDAFGNVFNPSWLLFGEGEMLKPQPQYIEVTDNIIESANNSGIMANIVNDVQIHHAAPAAKADAVAAEGESVVETRPLLPAEIAKKPNLDVYEYIREGRLRNAQYIGTTAFPPYDCAYRVTQDALAPFYVQGDVLALAALPKGATFLNGSAMVVDTYSQGFVLRFVYDREDALELRVPNKESYYEMTMLPKTDVIRLYRVVGLLRVGM